MRGRIVLLARADWAGFARLYNGKSYAKHAYDQKLKAAFAEAKLPAQVEGVSLPQRVRSKLMSVLPHSPARVSALTKIASRIFTRTVRPP